MDWQWYLIGYLLISLILCEGLIFHGKKTGKRTKTSEYILLLVLGPFTIILLIIANALRKGPK